MALFGNNNPAYQHGLANTRFARIYSHLKRRCSDSEHKDYGNYGGRGIECKWETMLEFKKDMYKSYLQHEKDYGTVETQIERNDVNGNYCRDNCSWATIKEQGRNRRNNRTITFEGKTQCVSAWAEELDMCKAVILYRLNNGWTPRQILTTEINHANKIRTTIRPSKKDG